MKKTSILLILLLANFLTTYGQFGAYTVSLKPTTINGLPGLQSFAWGKYNGYWVLIGGRLDGLHRRQPFTAFDVNGNNSSIYVVDPFTQMVYSAPVNQLPMPVSEQLQSTNMQFYQYDSVLYITGGYGYSATAGTHITHPILTALNLPGLINAIQHNNTITPHVRYITDQRLAVTGGHLGKLDSIYLLVCGNRFDGRYNPMGNPTFTQAYTNQIRKFTIADNGITLSLQNYYAVTDSLNLHRRDYNLTPAIGINGQDEYTIWTGVFQYQQNLPWLNTVNLQRTGHIVNNGFNQYLSHYHSAYLPMYDSISHLQYTVFFGGISQYYANDSGTVIRNDSVPFVKTISYVKRDANGSLSEHRLQTEMPGFLGAGAEVIPADKIPHYPNEVIRLHDLKNDSVLAGYMVGGINSSARNIFWINNGTQSTANATIYEIWLRKQSPTSVIRISDPIRWKVSVYPNPGDSHINILLEAFNPQDWIKIEITDMQGRMILPVYGGKADVSELQVPTRKLSPGIYYLTVQSGQVWHVERIAIR
jgi:hypothetical protein